MHIQGLYNNSPLFYLTSLLHLSLEKITYKFFNCVFSFFFLVVTFISVNVHCHPSGSLGNENGDLCRWLIEEAQKHHL